MYSIDMSSTGLNGVVGNTYRIKIGAENNVDEVVSDSIAVLLAGVPSQPSPPSSLSDGSYLEVIMTTPTSNGGIPLITYQLQLKYTSEGEWETVLGDDTNNLELKYMV